MIPPSEISRLAHRLGLSDRTIEKDYVLTWVLFAIADSPLRGLLAFKGGTAIKKVYAPGYRFSEDLDFTLLEPMTSNEDVISAVERLFPWLKREVNLTVAVRKVEVHSSDNPTIYLNYIGPLQGDLASRFLKVDFTRDEELVFPLQEKPLQVPYSDCKGRIATLLVYSPEEILAEKLRSLLTRTEPRDLYDVHYMFTNRLADFENMVFNMRPKFESKGLAVNDLRTILTQRGPTFDRLWEPRLRGQVPEVPPLENVIRETNRLLQRFL